MDEAKVEPLVTDERRLKPFRELVKNADAYRGQRPQPTDREITMGSTAYRYWTDGSLRRA